MFGTSQTDTLSTKVTSSLSIFRSFGIGANFQSADFINPAHQFTEVTAVGISFNGRNLTFNDLAFGTVQRYPIAFVNDNAAISGHGLLE